MTAIAKLSFIIIKSKSTICTICTKKLNVKVYLKYLGHTVIGIENTGTYSKFCDTLYTQNFDHPVNRKYFILTSAEIEAKVGRNCNDL